MINIFVEFIDQLIDIRLIVPALLFARFTSPWKGHPFCLNANLGKWISFQRGKRIEVDPSSGIYSTGKYFITKTRLFTYIESFTSKNWKFSDQNLWYVIIFLLKNINCGYSLEPPQRGGSYVYPQSLFLSSNKKNNVYPCKPQFYYIKVGFKGFNII